MKLKVTIVVVTLNRADNLDQTLTSLMWQDYSGDFEVIVVNGPSTDHTDDVIMKWKDKIKYYTNTEANISVSRNIGIKNAAGEIIAFIDDDAIPEPEWLSQLIEAYTDESVGAVGGFVYDYTGVNFQSRYCIVDRFGNAHEKLNEANPYFSFPYSFYFPHLMGTNMSFRKTCLLEIGGFDEEYEYYLDETDLCLRINDAGYEIKQLSNSFIHHKFAPSSIRTVSRFPHNRFSLIKNKIYFIVKHGLDYLENKSLDEISNEIISSHRESMLWGLKNDLISNSDLDSFDNYVERAKYIGINNGYGSKHKDSYLGDMHKQAIFHKFHCHFNERKKVVVLVSRKYHPYGIGGIATYKKDLAESLANLGHIVHVITESPDHHRVDFENGVWVHRCPVNDMPAPSNMIVPKNIWNWSGTAFSEVERIASHRTISVVEAPIWDCEGIAFSIRRKWPIVTGLQTNISIWLDSYPELRNDSDWMASFGTPIANIEKYILSTSNGIRAISKAILSRIEFDYSINISNDLATILPLGISAPSGEYIKNSHDRKDINILFVGRHEHRKGIDVLLEAIPLVLKENNIVKFKLIGSDPGSTCKNEFFNKFEENTFTNAVQFCGELEKSEVDQAFKECDIFVAPSRFESFGLVFIEAMSYGKPVVGCNIGGIPEIVDDKVNGLLVDPESVTQLVNALNKLISDKALRAELGLNGFNKVSNKFSAKNMAILSEDLYRIAEKNFQDDNSKV